MPISSITLSTPPTTNLPSSTANTISSNGSSTNPTSTTPSTTASTYISSDAWQALNDSSDNTGQELLMADNAKTSAQAALYAAIETASQIDTSDAKSAFEMINEILQQ